MTRTVATITGQIDAPTRAAIVGQLDFDPPAPSTLLTSLEAYYLLGEASGSRADSAGSNTLVDNNTVTQATGKQGNAAQFTRTNTEYLSIADNASMSTGDIDFTLDCWVYLDSKPSGSMTFASKFGSSGQYEYALDYEQASDRFRFYVSDNGSNLAILSATTFGSPSLSTWYYVAAYHDSVNNLTGIAVNNGTFDTLAHSTGVHDSTSAFQIGARSGANAMNGRIDEFGFWKKVLSAAEFTLRYNSGAGNTYPF